MLTREPLSLERRELLLKNARFLRRIIDDPQACRQAAAALVILQRHGIDGLKHALQRDLPAGGNAKAWSTLRPKIAVYVAKGPCEGAAELAFVLGWLRRLAALPADPGPRPAR